MRILITGAAGFIGYHLSRRLLDAGHSVVGADNLNPYYEVSLKEARLERLGALPSFRGVRMDIVERERTLALFEREAFEAVVNLAAQPGVRHSFDHPEAYIDTNIVGFANVLEGCRHTGVRHLVFASSSSVYGSDTRPPFRVSAPADHPTSLYGATKRANELMAHTYAHLYGLPATGLRFFSVFGPWGRPDMAYFSFTRALLAGETIPLFAGGRMRRDFTYIDDLTGVVSRILEAPPVPASRGAPDPSGAPFRLYNVGSDRPVEIIEMVGVLERILGVEARLEMLPPQPTEVPSTHADITPLKEDFGYEPLITLEDGLERFVGWYQEYYGRTDEPPPGA